MRFLWGILLLAWLQTAAAQAAVLRDAMPIYLYESAHTSRHLKQQELDYGLTLGRWRKYLKRYGEAHRGLSRDALLAQPEPGVLVLPGVQVLDAQERAAIARFIQRGGSLWGTGRIGTHAENGADRGFTYLEELFRVRVLTRPVESMDWYLIPFGDGPLSWPIAAGRRVLVGDSRSPDLLRVQSERLAGVYMDWDRTNDPELGLQGAIAFDETDGSRAVYFAFSETAWNFHKQADWHALLDATMAWLRHAPRAYLAAWPMARQAAHLLEMDTEDKFFSAPKLAEHLERIGVRGTFYCLTSIAQQYPEVVRDLFRRGHEVAYHADVHFGFRGLDPLEQDMRIQNMKTQMSRILGGDLAQATGFRAPTESYDTTTEVLLRKHGMLHHAADPSATEDRLPFFSRAEPGLGYQEALVVLPRTQLDDISFFLLRLAPQRILDIVKSDLDLAVMMGALNLLSVHSQTHVDGGLMSTVMGPYVQHVALYGDQIWVARGDDIAQWWRRRAAVQMRASYEKQSVLLSLRAPDANAWPGVTVMVSNPVKGRLPSVSVVEGKNVRWWVRAVDAFRSAVVIESASSDFQLALSF